MRDNSYKKEETPAKSYSYHFDSNETFGDNDIHRGNNGKYSIWYLSPLGNALAHTKTGTNAAQTYFVWFMSIEGEIQVLSNRRRRMISLYF